MEAKAYLRGARISPRKVQIVLDLIRGKDAATAMAILKSTPKAASELLIKLLGSAMANAENNHNMNKDSLYISTCFVSPGRIQKGIMYRGKGSADRLLKRSSHITMVLSEKE